MNKAKGFMTTATAVALASVVIVAGVLIKADLMDQGILNVVLVLLGLGGRNRHQPEELELRLYGFPLFS